MKQCPACKRTYPDDAPDYCSNDGMHLVREESAMFDPEKTVMSSGLSANQPAASQVSPPPPPATPQQQQQETPPSTSPPPAPPSQTQGSQPQQAWQQQGGNQYAPQGWTPPPPPPVSQASPSPSAWGSPMQQPQGGAPYGTPYVPPQSGRSRALAIAALVFGTNAITIMFVRLLTGMPYGPFSRIKILMGILSIAGVGLGVGALVMALKKSSRFGGVELAITGLATGTAALVYMLLN